MIWFVLAVVVLLPLAGLFLFVFAISMVAPTRHLVAWLAMLTLILALLPAAECDRAEGGFCPALVVVAWLLFGLAILIKLKITKSDSRPTHQGGAAMNATGALASLCFAVVFAWAIAEHRPVWIAHGTALVVAAGLWLLLPWGLSVGDAPGPMRSFVLGLRWSAAVLGVGAVAWFWWSIDAVIGRAETIAAGAPYCIQVVNSRGEYNMATALLGLSPLAMRARCGEGICRQILPALVVGVADRPARLSWSARQQDFVLQVPMSLVPMSPAIECRPQSHFARRLPTF